MGKIPVIENKRRRRPAQKKQRWKFLNNKPLRIVLVSLAAIIVAVFLWFFLYLPRV